MIRFCIYFLTHNKLIWCNSNFVIVVENFIRVENTYNMIEFYIVYFQFQAKRCVLCNKKRMLYLTKKRIKSTHNLFYRE